MLAISFISTLSSMWSLYEKHGNCAHVALKANKISKSSASLSTIVFLDNYFFISSNFLWSNLHLTKRSWYSFWDNIFPFSSQKKGKPFLHNGENDSIKNLISWFIMPIFASRFPNVDVYSRPSLPKW